jgi:acetyl-CoA C-acetyltransferase
MATASDPVVIVSAARTPLGRFMGDLSSFSARRLGCHNSRRNSGQEAS